MRRVLENALLVVAVLVFLAVVQHGWKERAELSEWLGSTDSHALDVLVGWLTIGGLLAVVGLIPLFEWGPVSRQVRTLVAVPLVIWGALAATYLWTPLAGGRTEWLDDLAAAGDGFQAGVVAAHWALAASLVLILVIGVAQVASPRWQPGNEENERRSAVASCLALMAPALVALVISLIV